MTSTNWLLARPWLAAVLFEGMLVPVALVLAWLLGVAPWTRFELTAAAAGVGVLATLPVLLAFVALGALRASWAVELGDQVRDFVEMLFRGAPAGSVLLVCALAGLGEELLFRGVIQDALEHHLGAAAGLVLASLIFGLAHFLTPAYFLLATLMGFYLGVLYLITDNLLVPVLVHALYDWVVIHVYLRTRGVRRVAAPEGR